MIFWHKTVFRMAMYITLHIFALSSVSHASTLSITPQRSDSNTTIVNNTTNLVYNKDATPNGPFTVTSLVHLNDTWDTGSSTPIVLIGFGEQTSGVPTKLALAWVQDQSTWVPRWLLVLAGQAQTHLAGVMLDADTFSLKNCTVLSKVAPMAGHTYAAALGYDPVAKNVALSVTDQTSGELLYASSQDVSTALASLVPSVGLATLPDVASVSTTVTVGEFGRYPEYIPVASRWEVGVGNEDDRAPSWLFTGTEPGYVLIETPGTIPSGEFRLSLQHDTQLDTIASVHPTKSRTFVSLPVGEFPLGKSRLKLEYMTNGQTWLSSVQDIVVGSVSADINPISVNKVSHIVSTTLNLHDEKPFAAFPITIDATISRMVWDEAQRIYRKQQYTKAGIYSGVVDVAQGNSGEPVALQVPIPADPGLWEVRFTATSSTGVIVQTSGGEQVFNTYAPAALEPGKPFTIAVLPDTQLYTRTDKPIFMRMTQWIAENAVTSNIGLVLHMGDITEQNQPGEWNIASESLHLLDGVVPYVLAVGNHDMLRPQDGYSVNDRDGSLINKYFPRSVFTSLQGSYTPDRVDNSFHTFQFGGNDYLVISIEYYPRPEVLQWASQVAATHPNHRVIVVTHSYLNSVGNRVDIGDSIWWDFVRRHPNILMVLCGHIPVSTVPNSVSKGEQNNLVFQLLFDYQGESYGGNGNVGLLQFQPDNTMSVQVYSPYLGRYKGDKDYYFGNAYIIDLGTGKVTTPK